MEKRLFLAMGLSFFVLFVWSLTTPNPTPRSFEDSQIIENKNLTEKNTSVVSEWKENTVKADVTKISEAQTFAVENDALLLETSSLGGVLKGVVIKKYGYELPLHEIGSVVGYENVLFQAKAKDPKEIIYNNTSGGLLIEKSYKIVRDDFVVQSEIRITNTTNDPKVVNLKLNAFSVNTKKINNKKNDSVTSRDAMLYEYLWYDGANVRRKNNAHKFTKKDRKDFGSGVEWVAFRDRYFAFIYKPEFDVHGFESVPDGEDILNVQSGIKVLEIKPGETIYMNSMIFAGPQEPNLLKSYNDSFEKLVSYKLGNFFDIFALGLGDVSAKLILVLLQWMHKIFNSWGFSIILVAVILCGISYPLMRKSMVSIKKSQAIQPKITELKEKHKNNPQKMNQEMMELYKKHGVNPFGGCLPMFLQMPIFFGALQILWRYVGLKGESFFWIKDLSEPDRLFVFANSFPIIGNEFNILPLIMFVLAIFQQIFSARNMPASDPNMIMQQKMMRYIFPAMIILFFYHFPSSTALYFSVFYTYQCFTQWKMSKENEMVKNG